VSLRFYQRNKDDRQYSLLAENFPEDKTYFLWQKTLAAGQPTRTPLELIIKKGDPTDSYGFVAKRADGGLVFMKPDGFAEGEALQVALMSEDRTIVALAKTIPNPIESVRDPYRIWVELATANSSGFIIWGEGFEPNKEMNTVSISEGETVMSKIRADAEGRFMTMVLPAVVGKQSGSASYSVAGKSGEVKVHYHWGQSGGQRIAQKDEAGETPQPDTDFKALFDDANLNFRQGQYDKAVKLYKKANKLRESESPECLWGLAQSYDKLGAYKNVEKTCERLIEACGDNPQYTAMAWNLIGNTLSNNAMKNPDKPDMKKLREAEHAYREVLLASPGLQTAHYNLGVLLIRMDQVSEGIEELRASMAAKGDAQIAEKARKTIDDPRRAIYDFAPDFSMVTSDGEYITSDELRGKVILLDFWGTWCPPCRNALPDLKRLAKKYSDKEFRLVSIDVNDPEERWMEFLEENKMEWTQVRDDKSSLKRTFQVSAFPTYILIDHDGIIRTRIKGASSQNHSRVSDEIRKALKNLEKTAAVSLQQR
jgi:thiol-disulfide isomerase/thioredoxin